MFRRHVLGALAIGIAAGDDDAARAALGRIEPVARAGTRRALERALIDAALACDAAQLRVPPPAHVMRLAALAVAGRPSPEAADPAAIARAYAALPAAALPRFPMWTLLAVLALVAVAGGITAYVVTRPPPPSRIYVRALPPPSAAAYQEGGVPLRDPAIDALLTGPLTTLVVEAGRVRAGGDGASEGKKTAYAQRRDELRAPAALAARGPALAAAWTAAIDQFDRSLAVAQRGDRPTAREHDELVEAVRELSAQFAAAGLGYFLEGRFKRGAPFLQAYGVAEVVFVIANGAPRRVLSLRRLDRLNTSYALLGMHDEDLGDPVLMLDRIDISVASTVLPALATAAPYPLADREWLAWPLGTTLAIAVGEAVRREVREVLGADAEALGQIANLLVERGRIIEDWRDTLGRARVVFVDTDALFVPASLLASLEGLVPTSQRERVAACDAQLAALEAPRIHARVHDLVAASVRRHEAQHGFDYDRDAELRYPAPLAELLGSPFDGAGGGRPIVRSARAELSAYLSEIANNPRTPQASLWNLGRQVFSRHRWGTGEFYAGLVVLEGLARQLGVPVEARRYRAGELDRERLARLATALAATPGPRLRAAATTLWTELYGEPLTTITDAPAPAPAAAR